MLLQVGCEVEKFFVTILFYHLKVDTIEFENSEELQELYKMVCFLIQAIVLENYFY